MIDIDWLRRICLSLPGATEQVQWDHNLVFKVGGKMFAIVPLEPAPLSLSFKCSDDDFAELIERPGVIPAPYLARAHWVALESDVPLPHPELEGLLRNAHTLVVANLPKRLQANLQAPQPRASRPTTEKTHAQKSPRRQRP